MLTKKEIFAQLSVTDEQLHLTCQTYKFFKQQQENAAYEHEMFVNSIGYSLLLCEADVEVLESVEEKYMKFCKKNDAKLRNLENLSAKLRAYIIVLQEKLKSYDQGFESVKFSRIPSRKSN